MTAAESKATNTAVPSGDAAPHDRVVMLSLKKDGEPDQVNPEIIGDKEFAKSAARRQFAEQAVSAADDAERAANSAAAGGPGGERVEQDPTIAARQKEHEKIAGAAEKRADAAVEALHKK